MQDTERLLLIMCALHEAEHGEEVTLGCDDLDIWWYDQLERFGGDPYGALVCAGADETTLERYVNAVAESRHRKCAAEAARQGIFLEE